MKILPAGQKMHEIPVLIGTEPLWRVACGAVLLERPPLLRFRRAYVENTEESTLAVRHLQPMAVPHNLAR